MQRDGPGACVKLRLPAERRSAGAVAAVEEKAAGAAALRAGVDRGESGDVDRRSGRAVGLDAGGAALGIAAAESGSRAGPAAPAGRGDVDVAQRANLRPAGRLEQRFAADAVAAIAGRAERAGTIGIHVER